MKEDTNIVTLPSDEQAVSPLVKMAMNQNLDPERLSQLLEVQKEWEANEARKAFSAAMAACQREMPLIAKNAFNEQTQSKFAKHEKVCKEIKPVYTKHGFSLSFSEGKADKDNEIRILCDVDHEMGYSKQYHLDIGLDKTGIKGSVNKTDIHAKGSTLTYGRRYLTLMIFDLATYDDTDGTVAPPDIDCISGEQSSQIYAWLQELKTLKSPVNEAGFLKWYKADSVETIAKHRFKDVERTLKGKIQKAQEAAGDNS